ncbi:DMT family transporter [Streptomyces sp. NPDC059850]|uniref:DMT family transporter n=1 Tax=Streptomyces sp. NPDC059850 TaxID=3346970 RepID=UPI0036502338
MAWILLMLSGLLETVWAAALSASHGFSRLRPTLLFVAAAALSMAGLSYAMRSIPIGTGYAVWVAIGAVGTAVYGMIALGDPVSAGRIVCLGLIVSGVVGLKLLH